MPERQGMMKSDGTVLALSLTLIGLAVLLFFLYKKLKKVSDGEYSVQRMVYKEGGVRDQVREAVFYLETRLGVQLWPRGDSEVDGQEMRDVSDVEARGSCHSVTEGDEEREEEEKEEGDSTSCGGENAEGGSCGADSEERVKLVDETETRKEKVEESEDKQDEAKGAELLIDLNNFSGSAVWSEEQGGVDASDAGTT